MQEFIAKISSPVGLHARPAALFSQAAKDSGCLVKLAKIIGNQPLLFVDGASILRIMTLDVKHGDEIVVRIEGELEVETSKKLKALVESSGH